MTLVRARIEFSYFFIGKQNEHQLCIVYLMRDLCIVN